MYHVSNDDDCPVILIFQLRKKPGVWDNEGNIREKTNTKTVYSRDSISFLPESKRKDGLTVKIESKRWYVTFARSSAAAGAVITLVLHAPVPLRRFSIDDQRCIILSLFSISRAFIDDTAVSCENFLRYILLHLLGRNLPRNNGCFRGVIKNFLRPWACFKNFFCQNYINYLFLWRGYSVHPFVAKKQKLIFFFFLIYELKDR